VVCTGFDLLATQILRDSEKDWIYDPKYELYYRFHRLLTYFAAICYRKAGSITYGGPNKEKICQ
jgi:hypothetical protein